MSGPPRPLRRLAVLWPRFGPYHLARLRAVDARCRAERAELVAVEVARHDALYPWAEAVAAEPFRRARALPDATVELAAPADVRAAVTRVLDEADPDAVAFPSYATPDARAALRWCRRRRRAAVMLFDSRAEDAPRSPMKEAVKRVLVAQADAALVAGTPQAVYLEALGMPPERTFRPVDVVDNAYFRDGAEAAGVAERAGFLSVNRMVARKNLGALVEAYRRYRAAALARGAEPWPLVLVGDGPERAALEASAPEGVTFTGARPVEALPALYARAGCYVHPAAVDPWGLVVNEAMATGLPVVVSRGAGCAPDLVDGNGWTVGPGDLDGLAARLAEVAEMAPEAREALGARSLQIIAGYTPETFANGLWRAAEAGLAVADRPASPAGRAVLAAFRLATRRHQSFHALPE